MNRGEILDTAKTIVSADRQNDYGTPERNFETIAELWRPYIRARHHVDVVFDGVDVAVMLGQVKVARLATSPGKEDNWVDLAGYAACGGEVATDAGR